MAKQRVTTGQRVVLTNPNYPDIRYVGEFVSGAIAGEPHIGKYSTFTVRDDNGQQHRSEGVLTLEEES